MSSYLYFRNRLQLLKVVSLPVAQVTFMTYSVIRTKTSGAGLTAVVVHRVYDGASAFKDLSGRETLFVETLKGVHS